MGPEQWADIQAKIFPGESGGDYNALFGFQNRTGGRYAGANLQNMTVDQALEFAAPSGDYGQWVKGQIGRVATPMGAYQVVGTTLRDAKNGLGLSGSEKMNMATQDRIGQWIYKTQGPGAWEAWGKGSGGATPQPTIGSQAMQVLGKTLPKQQPSGILATPQERPEPMQQPRGLLGSMGIQKMQEGAEGETGQRFYQRDSFKDTAAKMGQAFAALGSNPGVQKFTNDVANQRTETKSRNKTVEYLRANGMGDMASMVEAGDMSAGGVMSAIMQKRLAGPKDGPTFRAATPEEAARYQAASGQIDMATGRFYDTSPSGGFSVTTRPDGTTIVTQGGKGGGASPKLTDGQAKNTAFFGRATSSNEILDKFEMEGTGLRQIIGENLPMGNYLLTDEGQQYDQAKRDFINAILRQESGAAIGKNEFDSANVQYFPQPGDGNAVIAQKKQNRIQKIRGLGAGMGEGRIETGGEQPTHDATGKRITR